VLRQIWVFSNQFFTSMDIATQVRRRAVPQVPQNGLSSVKALHRHWHKREGLRAQSLVDFLVAG